MCLKDLSVSVLATVGLFTVKFIFLHSLLLSKVWIQNIKAESFLKLTFYPLYHKKHSLYVTPVTQSHDLPVKQVIHWTDVRMLEPFQ